MSTIRDDSIRDVTINPTKVALSNIGDGAGLVFSSHEDELEEYIDFTSIDPVRIGNNKDYFTSFFRTGKTEFQSKDQIKFRASWAQSSCICLDISCTKMGAIDIFGVWESDNGELRGETPILLLDDDGQTPLPCLSHSKLPPIKDLDIIGCNWNGTRFGRKNLVGVFQCGPDSVENLKFIDRESGKAVARSLSKYEIVPQLSEFDPDLKMVDVVNHPLLQVNDSVIEYPVLFFEGGLLEFEYTFDFDLAPILNEAKTGLILTTFDALGEAVRDEDFSPDYPASNATVAEIIRISDAFTKNRLLTSVSWNESIVEATIRASPLFLVLSGSRPESSPPQEIYSGVALLILASCGFGAVLAVYLRERNNAKAFALFVSFAYLFLETIAYYLRREAENDQNAFNEAMVLATVASGDRFGGLVPLSAGKDGVVFAVTTYSVEMTDESHDYSWLFISGTVGSIISLICSYVFGPDLVDG